jgi:signal transduction histidine kinase
MSVSSRGFEEPEDDLLEFLKSVSLFANLADHALKALSQVIEEVRLPTGAELFVEGSEGDRAYIVRAGEIEVFKASGVRSVLIDVNRPGDVLGEIALIEKKPRMASARARTPCVLLAIDQAQFQALLASHPSAAQAMFKTVISRWRSTEAILRQSEKLAQLGTLAAGVAHELNNPSAAVRRGADQLLDVFAQLQQSQLQLYALNLTPAQLAALASLEQQVRKRAKELVAIDALAQSDLEYALESALEDLGAQEPWALAPTLASLGYAPAQLTTLAATFPAHHIATILAWLSNVYQVYLLLSEIGEGAGRIAEIVKVMKSYVYLDQAPVQHVDIHEGLDNTLVLLRNKLRPGIVVQRQYAEALPRIQGYGSELNQAWTNIIDNAIDAMQGQGQLTLRTYAESGQAVVEIEDTGPGIPTAIQHRIFDPFFTTKPVGQGAGLGLYISFNIIVDKHRGDLSVDSQTGRTRFVAKLPISLDVKE